MIRSKCIALVIVFAALAASCGGNRQEAVVVGQAEADLIDSNVLYPAQFYSLIDQDLINGFDGSVIIEIDRIQDETLRICMAERGFEFPVKPTQVGGFEPPERGISELDFAQRYGLGVAHFGSQTVQVGPSTDYVAEHIAELSQIEAISFGLAYYGESDGAIEDFNPEDEVTASCLDQSLEAANVARMETSSLAQLDVMSNAVVEINQRFRADSRTTAAYAPYGSCMREAGYEADLPAGATAIAQRNFGEFLGEHRKVAGVFDAAGQEALAQTIETEIRIALASLSCEAPLRPLLSSIYLQMEQEWIALNGPTLAALGSLG